MSKGITFERMEGKVDRVPDDYNLRCQGCKQLFKAKVMNPIWVDGPGAMFVGGLCPECWEAFEFKEAVRDDEGVPG